jgi:hypothetical protein
MNKSTSNANFFLQCLGYVSKTLGRSYIKRFQMIKNRFIMDMDVSYFKFILLL